MGKTAEEFKISLGSGENAAEVNVILKNSPRARNFRASVSGGGCVVLSKPRWASRRDAVQFLLSVSEWVLARVRESPEVIRLAEYLEKTPRLSIGGEEWKVWLRPSRAGSFFVEDASGGEVVFLSGEEGISKVFKKFAAQKISALVRKVSEEAGIGFSRVSVRDQRGRWASRSSSGTLSFNWRVILLPAELQNYVVCHELAHARFMDHSVSFWIFLDRLCPNAKALDRALSKTGKEIFAVDGT